MATPTHRLDLSMSAKGYLFFNECHAAKRAEARNVPGTPWAGGLANLSKCLRQPPHQALGELLTNFGVSWGIFTTSSLRLGASWERLGASWERLRNLLGRFGSLSGRLGSVPGGAWEHFGIILGYVGSSKDTLKASWKR